MSKSTVASKESGSFSLGKNHGKPAHQHGPVDTGKLELPLKEQGVHARKDKPLLHVENDTTHNGRPHPPATKLASTLFL